jgi:hypothetical protein
MHAEVKEIHLLPLRPSWCIKQGEDGALFAERVEVFFTVEYTAENGAKSSYMHPVKGLKAADVKSRDPTQICTWYTSDIEGDEDDGCVTLDHIIANTAEEALAKFRLSLTEETPVCDN